MKSYAELANALQKADESWDISGPQPVSRVEEVEQKHGIRLPESYRRFLTQVGRIEYPNHAFTGIDDEYLHTEYGFMCHNDMIRSQCGLPDGLLVLEYDHDMDQLACLDLKQLQDDECPVVWFHVYKAEVVGECAKSFDEFFRRLVDEWTG